MSLLLKVCQDEDLFYGIYLDSDFQDHGDPEWKIVYENLQADMLKSPLTVIKETKMRYNEINAMNSWFCDYCDHSCVSSQMYTTNKNLDAPSRDYCYHCFSFLNEETKKNLFLTVNKHWRFFEDETGFRFFNHWLPIQRLENGWYKMRYRNTTRQGRYHPTTNTFLI